MKKIIDFVFDTIYYVLIILCCTFIISFFVGIKPYFVPTGSMEPNLHADSLVFVNEKFDYEELEVGDIIVYERPSDKLLIIHRVIEITDDGVYTKGDANPVEDGVCITQDIFNGKCIYVIPEVGKYMAPLHELRTTIFSFFSSPDKK